MAKLSLISISSPFSTYSLPDAEPSHSSAGSLSDIMASTRPAPKSKNVVQMLKDFSVDSKTLIITADMIENVEKSSRNIPGVKAISSCGLNVYDILNHNKLFITKDAITRIEEVLA